MTPTTPTTPPAPFFAIGGSPAIDLVNTEIVDHHERIDLLRTWADVPRWATQMGLITKEQADELLASKAEHARSLASIKSLRADIRAALERFHADQPIPARSLSALNASLAADASHDELVIIDSRPTLRKTDVRMTPAQLSAIIARAAATLLANADNARVRPCGGADCILWFHDTSKSGTRRWCTMEICGNRAKARAFSERHRE